MLQRALHHRERELVPGDLVDGREPHLEALGARRHRGIHQAGAEHHVHLADMRDRVDGVEVQDLDFRIRLLERFARRALGRRLVVLHEARGQRPQATARLDRALADEDPVPVGGEAPHDHLGILVVDRPARVAHGAHQGVALGDAQRDRRAAGMAELDQGAGVI